MKSLDEQGAVLEAAPLPRRPLPHIRMVNKFPREERLRSIAAVVERRLPEFTELIDRHRGGSAIIIGGGPSLNEEVATIQRLQGDGARILCIERMYPWCHLHGITPDYVVAQDGSEDVIEAFPTIWPGSMYLLAAQVRPAVYDRLSGESVYFFHTSGDIDQTELGGPGPIGTLVNAGGSVTLCSLCLALLMGLSKIHLFGFDCHVGNGTYAKGIAANGMAPECIQAHVGARTFTTTLSYAAFARQFFELVDIGQRDGLLTSLTVYGDSMVTAMSRQPAGVSDADE